jgi:DNA-binding transcriptional ArsR family regulator
VFEERNLIPHSGIVARIDANEPARGGDGQASAPSTTSIDKAFEVCEALSHEPAGMSLSELARTLKLPRPTVHRLLAVLRRRGYVRQDEETQRYSLGIKLLDLCFRMLGRSELRLHAYPILRDYAVQSGYRTFLAVPGSGEVTYIWSAGPDEAAMRTVYGREMPAHCSVYFDASPGNRRLSCLRLAEARDVGRSAERLRHFGPEAVDGRAQRLFCCCAPVFDYSGREVARVGVFGHGPDDRPVLGVHNRGAWELARHISMRLGYLSAVAFTA